MRLLSGHRTRYKTRVLKSASGLFLPRPVLTVVGLKAVQTMVSQMFVAMNKEIPDPRP